MDERKNLIETVRLCQKGDSQSFSALVDMYSSRLFGYFYRLTGNRTDAEELLSEIFLKLVEKIADCKAQAFEGWLFRMASNLFTDYIRSKKRQEKMLNKAAEDAQLDKNDTEPENYLVDKLTMQLQRLDPETAEIVVMRYYSGLSFEQLAEIRNEPVGTCLSKVHRAIKKLRQLMENCDE